MQPFPCGTSGPLLHTIFLVAELLSKLHTPRRPQTLASLRHLSWSQTWETELTSTIGHGPRPPKLFVSGE